MIEAKMKERILKDLVYLIQRIKGPMGLNATPEKIAETLLKSKNRLNSSYFTEGLKSIEKKFNETGEVLVSCANETKRLEVSLKRCGSKCENLLDYKQDLLNKISILEKDLDLITKQRDELLVIKTKGENEMGIFTEGLDEEREKTSLLKAQLESMTEQRDQLFKAANRDHNLKFTLKQEPVAIKPKEGLELNYQIVGAENTQLKRINNKLENKLENRLEEIELSLDHTQKRFEEKEKDCKDYKAAIKVLSRMVSRHE